MTSNTTGDIQTRSFEGELRYFDTVAAAFDYAKHSPSVWKVSFPLPDNSRARFVRYGLGWRWEPMPEF